MINPTKILRNIFNAVFLIFLEVISWENKDKRSIVVKIATNKNRLKLVIVRYINPVNNTN